MFRWEAAVLSKLTHVCPEIFFTLNALMQKDVSFLQTVASSNQNNNTNNTNNNNKKKEKRRKYSTTFSLNTGSPSS